MIDVATGSTSWRRYGDAGYQTLRRPVPKVGMPRTTTAEHNSAFQSIQRMRAASTVRAGARRAMTIRRQTQACITDVTARKGELRIAVTVRITPRRSGCPACSNATTFVCGVPVAIADPPIHSAVHFIFCRRGISLNDGYRRGIGW